MASYKLAEGWDNAAGLIDLEEIMPGDKPLDSHATSLAMFRGAREFETLAGLTDDDGDDVWEWEFASLTPANVQRLETLILGGKRSNYCTVETRNRHSQWVVRSAVMTLPATFSLVGEKFGDVVIRFIKGQPVS